MINSNLPPILHRFQGLIIGQILASESIVSHVKALAGVIPYQYRHKW